MDRKNFIKKTILGAVGVTTGAAALNAKDVKLENSTYDKLMKQVGFNHLPNKEIKTMKSVLHKADTRGHANHGWLDSHHTFSFANYRNPERMNFGVLRVLNDDVVTGGRGFGTHPHDNMEIISIPLQGDLEHQDSMGNKTVIKQGDVQVMSAGTGVQHSEYNKNKNDEVRFLQIWMFPSKKNVTPRYGQITLDSNKATNGFQQVLSPSPDDEGVWAHQNAWFNIGEFASGCEETYEIKDKQNGVYAFVLEGEINIEGQDLSKRDGFGVWDTDKISIKATKGAKVLLMDVPMQLN
ncbi:MAG: redox-sensitive bicupin YhaK (pirin superfamily) [Ulvibacter sp.]|jgi:redox-sensitive bicupin YhaK (pirin superfamily)